MHQNIRWSEYRTSKNLLFISLLFRSHCNFKIYDITSVHTNIAGPLQGFHAPQGLGNTAEFSDSPNNSGNNASAIWDGAIWTVTIAVAIWDDAITTAIWWRFRCCDYRCKLGDVELLLLPLRFEILRFEMLRLQSRFGGVTHHVVLGIDLCD